ncbi:precorrin-6Y C5,15-methyltransferase (decarboxylating) subunit CbiT [Rhodococcus sp. IEGM 1408]|uniref:precorrin-6Y C5,15-methyltransferase (decarboxylating) subunit CbiT n=1 Tax=Rhodococcus sp. IEGM 1408 TaxID=3082220 RepID=UPI002954DE94|nr:precorrin-6Y C5,15-methyltransferase (decarboxylating) subunit CbiT [Rhodococcus sp. IEGM 1408]MDV8002976.1 precorrin-6Y C5,15-methyltransferase (decarboxylating) subunit CbiT [Rhodococcus sp. IEGM 1408]
MNARVVVVGIGGDGWAGLDEARRRTVREADVLLGGERHLALVPGDVAAERVPWPRPLRAGFPEVLERFRGRSIVALASGDPLVAGVATTLIDLLGAEAVEVLPAVSSVALGRARMRWPAATVAVVRDHRVLARELAPGRRLLVLSADRYTPSEVASMLTGAGFGGSALTVLSDLGSPSEARTSCRARDWEPGREAPALHVLAVECVAGASARPLGLAPGLPDDAFENDGQLTRRDLRASALSRLAPSAGELLWDVGAGAGSVGIEWMRVHPSCRTIAVEADPERASRIERNARTLGVPSLELVHGWAPQALDGLPDPDAVFVGGGSTASGLLRQCWDAVRPGGRLVAHAVTLETERVLVDARAEFGGELTRLQGERADSIGRFTGWAPARAVVQWAAVKPFSEPMEETS